MTKTPTTQEALNRAEALMQQRRNVIEEAIQAHQHLEEILEETTRQRAELETHISQKISEATNATTKTYKNALAAGWSAPELKKIGLTEPAKKTRPRRKPQPKKQPETTPQTSPTEHPANREL